MNTKIIRFHRAHLPNRGKVFALLLAAFAAASVIAQPTAFTYQGRLNDGANPASGSYDLTFALYDAANGGNQVGGVLTNAATGVSNGLFTVTLDFGNQFPGADRWLEIGVRTTGGGAFATLAPRQQVTSTPYSVRAAAATSADTAMSANTAASASSVEAANISGTIADAQLSANVALLNGNNSFTGNNALTDVDLRLRGINDPNHGLGYYGAIKTFPGFNQDGPVLYGYSGGALGTSFGGQQVSLVWDNSGRVGIGTNPTTSRLEVNGAVTAGSFFGDGSGLANLNASQLVSGAVPDGRLSANVPRLNSNNEFTGTLTAGNFSGNASGLTNVGVQALSQPVQVAVVWGDNFAGQTNVPAGLNHVSAMAAGGAFILALKADGTIVGWGDNTYGQTSVPAGLNNVSAIAAGGYHSLALKSDGTVVAWGYNGNGQTSVPAGLNNVSAIAAGLYHSLALRNDGTVVAWGGNSAGQTNVPVGLSSVITVAGGWYHSLALRNDGTVVGWGDDSYGQTNVPVLNNVIGIAAGGYHNLALQNDGTIVPWGDNSLGQTNLPGGLSNVIGVAAADYHSLALRSDGTVVAWGYNGSGQTNVPAGLNGVVSVAASGGNSLALQHRTGQAPIAVLTEDNTFQGAVKAAALVGSGAGVTNLNAASLASGTLADARLSANVALLNANQSFTGANTFNNAANSFSGNGGGLTNLPAANLTGSVADARLSTNVALLNAGTNIFNSVHANVFRARGGAPGGFGANNNGYAFLGNGGDNDSGMFSSADGQVEFYDNAVERMRIAPTGNVGIGITNPASALQVNGTVTATSFTGNGGGLTNLNASVLSLGSVPDARLSVNVALLNSNQAFTGANTFNNAANSFSGNGGGLTNLPATNLAGTIADARLSVNVALLNTKQTFSSSNTFSGVVLLTNANNTIAGNGAGLTSLTAANLTGTVVDGRLSANVALLSAGQTFSGTNVFSGTNRFAGVVQATNVNNQFTGNFIGNGGGLTNLDATELTGTVDDGQLSGNVALRAGGNTFSGSQQVSDTVITGSLTVDQQQLIQDSGSGTTDNWQSFTPSISGFLTAVALSVGSPIYPSPSSGSLSIYTGAGVNGTLLATQAVTWAPLPPGFFQTNSFSVPPYLHAGTKYTIRFGAPTETVGWVDVATTNPYPGGRADLNSTWDYLFKTFMIPAATNSTVLMVNPAGNSGNVGIGTNAPQAKLHVVGDVLASGTFTGNGAGLTSLNASQLTSGTVADGRLSTNVALLNGTNVFTGTFYGSPPYLRFAETNANGTGGSAVAGANNFREFNAELTDTHNLGSVSAGDIVLPAGTYQCRISAPAFRIQTHQIRLRTSAGVSLLFGTVGYTDESTNGSEDRSQIDGQFTIGATTTLRVQHFCSIARATDGLGSNQGFDWGDGSNQYIFAVAEFWKIK